MYNDSSLNSTNTHLTVVLSVCSCTTSQTCSLSSDSGTCDVSPSVSGMEGSVWEAVSTLFLTTPIFPLLWTASCTVLCGAARLTLGDKVHQLSRTNPLSLYLLSLLYCYPGAIISGLMQAQPPLLLLTKTNQLATFSLVWYLIFYTPLHKFSSIPSISLVLTLAQDWMRLREFVIIPLDYQIIKTTFEI